MITNLRKKSKRGFTLVEVIIVLAIIAIIAAIAIPNLTQVRRQSKIKADTQSAESIRRTVITLITEDTLKVDDDSYSFELSFTGGKATGVVSGNGSDAVTDIESMIKDASGKDSDYIDGFFIDIKEPQSDFSTGYRATVQNDGNVSVAVTYSDFNPDNIETGSTSTGAIVVQ